MYYDYDEFNLENVRGLSSKQKEALPLLIHGGTNRGVAEIVGVNKNTISNWRKDPLFRDAEIEMATQHSAETARNFTYLSYKSVEILNELLDSDNPQLKFQVAKYILDKSRIP